MCFYFLCFDYTIQSSSSLAQSIAKPVVIKNTTSLRKTSFRKPSVKQSKHLFWSHGWFCSFSGFALPYLFPFYTGSWIIFTDQQIRVTRVTSEKSYDSTMRVVVHFSRIFLSDRSAAAVWPTQQPGAKRCFIHLCHFNLADINIPFGQSVLYRLHLAFVAPSFCW